MSFKPEFVELFKAVLDDPKLPANSKWNKLVELMSNHGISYTLEKVHPKYFLVHPKNRGGLGLNAHNVHKNGGVIASVGADIKKLDAAWAFELAPNGPDRDKAVKFNADLVQRADGLLPQITGVERFCTVGTGHTTALCKHVGAPGTNKKTSDYILKGADGFLDTAKLLKDPDMNTMCTVGWTWNIIPAAVDKAFPKLAQVAQAALNASNNVASLVSELETACTLGETLADLTAMYGADAEAMALDNVKAICAPCAGYAHTILKFVKEFAGGAGAPQIVFVDNVAKQFGCNHNVGEVFWATLTSMYFGKENTCARLRSALLLVNLVCGQKEDGFSKLLKKEHLNKLTAKAKQATVKEAEETLKHGMEIVDSLCSCSGLTGGEAIGPLGKLYVRVGLLVTGMGAKGIEGVEYTMKEIKSKFLADLSKDAGAEVEYPDWALKEHCVHAEKAYAEKASAKAAPSGIVSLAQHDDPVFFAKSHGFEIGTTVVEKGTAAVGSNLYCLTSIGKEVKLAQICHYSGEPLLIQIKLIDLINGWSKHKGELPVKMDGHGQVISNALFMDMTKIKLFEVCCLAALDNKAAMDGLTFYKKPDEVRVLNWTPKGQLLLAPVAPLSNFTTKPGKDNLSLGQHSLYDAASIGKTEFYIIPPRTPPLANTPRPSTWADGADVLPYWWVASTADESLANMKLKMVKINDINVPCLTNSIDLAAGVKLWKFKAKEEVKKPIMEKLVISGGSDASSGWQPKKRAKKSN